MRNKKIDIIRLKCKDCKTLFDIYFTETTKIKALLTIMSKHCHHKIDIIIIPHTIGTIDRPMFLWMINEYYITCSSSLIGVEIGVNEGENAFNILTTMNIKKLYLIDPYIPYNEDGKIMDFTDSEKRMRKLLASHHKNIKIIKDTSKNAVNEIPDNSVDFVYIDGNHSYEYVKEDLELYYPKLKSGGIMGGHDFSTETLGVVKAVIEFMEKNHIKKLDGRKHSTERDWWFIKP